MNVICGVQNQQEPSDNCKTSYIDCGLNTMCSVSCFGKTSCGDSIIDAETADSLTVICDNEDACKATEITCPYPGGINDCVIECNDEKSCLDLYVFGACTCLGDYCPASLC